MSRRVARHRRERDASWQTIECPVDISGTLNDLDGKAGVILIDCLTLWVSNLLADPDRRNALEKEIDSLQAAVTGAAAHIVMVTNEVGGGIVPENPLARVYRDWVGLVNQRLAAVASRVVWMVSGCPVGVKGDLL